MVSIDIELTTLSTPSHVYPPPTSRLPLLFIATCICLELLLPLPSDCIALLLSLLRSSHLHFSLIIDHRPFLSDRFDVNAYANAVLSGKTYRPDDEGDEGGSKPERNGVAEDKGRGDVSVELAMLNYGIVCLLSSQAGSRSRSIL